MYQQDEREKQRMAELDAIIKAPPQDNIDLFLGSLKSGLASLPPERLEFAKMEIQKTIYNIRLNFAQSLPNNPQIQNTSQSQNVSAWGSNQVGTSQNISMLSRLNDNYFP